jgi:hypothetical protein
MLHCAVGANHPVLDRVEPIYKKNQVPADKLDMSDLLIPVTVGKAGLNLITCGGKFLKESDTYQDRVIVYAEQVL